jgi:xylulokinase
LLEGVAFSLRDTFEIFKEMNVPVEAIRLGGGGARAPVWRQIQADVYGRPVELVETEEGAAYGAALLAGVGARAWDTVDDACAAAVRTRATIEPTSADLMETRYQTFRKLYPALRVLY